MNTKWILPYHFFLLKYQIYVFVICRRTKESLYFWVFNEYLIWNVNDSSKNVSNCQATSFFSLFFSSSLISRFALQLYGDTRESMHRVTECTGWLGWLSERRWRQSTLQRPRSREVTVCQADGPPRSYPRSLRAEYAFRLVVSRLGWVTSPERGRPPSAASEIRYII